MITKHQAATLWANGYRLVDKEGQIYQIINPAESAFSVKKEGVKKLFSIVYFDWIGFDYFILARPLSDLTKEITHEGKKFVPAKILWSIEVQEEENFDLYGTIPDYWKSCIVLAKKHPKTLDVFTQERMHEWHFNIGFPEKCIKPLKD